eukprot:gnl/MRDRNA2_/MRDRNA2_90127_c0_seq1.p1 gnl/MRDRNA2_/MRDRNA2_90127_c0~~gnl/MRDRNA2_/MRDRNA2_90127_c0_seq1.p1  ORF type:complete len:219 (+),score=20.24 gnl/MRDRNA2_/MRDRNA2_90127_c0_seq1:93-749(+)
MGVPLSVCSAPSADKHEEVVVSTALQKAGVVEQHSQSLPEEDIVQRSHSLPQDLSEMVRAMEDQSTCSRTCSPDSPPSSRGSSPRSRTQSLGAMSSLSDGDISVMMKLMLGMVYRDTRDLDEVETASLASTWIAEDSNVMRLKTACTSMACRMSSQFLAASLTTLRRTVASNPQSVCSTGFEIPVSKRRMRSASNMPFNNMRSAMAWTEESTDVTGLT